MVKLFRDFLNHSGSFCLEVSGLIDSRIQTIECNLGMVMVTGGMQVTRFAISSFVSNNCESKNSICVII